MTKDEVLRLALEYVELVPDDRYNAEHIDQDALITAIKAALEAQTRSVVKDEPVSIIEQLWTIIDDIDTYGDMAKSDDKLYRSMVERRQKERWGTGITTDGYTLNIPTPPQRTWVGLTDEEREQVINTNTATGLWHMAKDIEAKLKEKNGYA